MKLHFFSFQNKILKYLTTVYSEYICQSPKMTTFYETFFVVFEDLITLNSRCLKKSCMMHPFAFHEKNNSIWD